MYKRQGDGLASVQKDEDGFVKFGYFEVEKDGTVVGAFLENANPASAADNTLARHIARTRPVVPLKDLPSLNLEYFQDQDAFA